MLGGAELALALGGAGQRCCRLRCPALVVPGTGEQWEDYTALQGFVQTREQERMSRNIRYRPVGGGSAT